MAHLATLVLLLFAGAVAGPAAAQEEEYHFDDPAPRLRLTAWGGASFLTDQGGAARGWAGAEVAWLLARGSLSLLYEHHRSADASASPPPAGGQSPPPPAVAGDRAWTPVVLLRWEQRFETRPGLEAGLTLGFGAGRPRDWVFWYHLALVARLVRDPWFLSCELGVERADAVRAGAGIGVAF